MFVVAIAMTNVPVGMQMLFAFVTPVFLVRWHEKRRTARLQSEHALSDVEPPTTQTPIQHRESARPVRRHIKAELPQAHSVAKIAPAASRTPEHLKLVELKEIPKGSRTKELREKLFGDDTSIFDQKNAQRVEEITSRIPPPDEITNSSSKPPDRSTSHTYRPKQDNAELIRVGKAAREALEAASARRAAEKRSESYRQESTNQDRDAARRVLETGATETRHSRIEELREKLFGHEPAPDQSPSSAELSNQIGAPKETSSPRPIQGWVPKGQAVTIAGREIAGMIYMGVPPRIGSSYYTERCGAYIDPAEHVSEFGNDRNGDNLPYWPSYFEIPSICRATYLDWLAGERVDGSISPGYLFLFFYGLERRFLIDQPSDEEKQEIVAEVERLKALFSDNYSVQRYLGEFLDIARIMAMGGFSLDDATLKQAILESRSWDLPFSLKFALGSMIGEGKAIDAEWLHLWLHCHPERRLRTPAERCGNEFKALFKLKFDALYPDGLKVRTPRKLLKMDYRAASGEFNCSVNLTAGDGGDVAIPDVADFRSPVQKAQKIADEAMDELDKFSRYLGRNPDGRGTIEAQALLPAELWSLFPSAELEELKDWARERIAAGGLIPALDVIARLEGETPEKLGKRNLTGAADALARIGFGMAPDPRFSLRGPKIDEPVVIFELGEPVEQLEEVSPAYRTELFELALATFVAHADSKLVEAERRSLRDKVEATTGLTELERKRLHANLEWYLDVPPDMSWLRSKLKDADAEHHLALRAAVVAIAHADSVIQSEEVACIEKIYKALGIDAGLVYADLHAGDVPDGPVRVKAAESEAPGEQIPDEPKAKAASLDAARIAAIRNDTERVSSVLSEIFSTNEDVSDEATAAHALPSSMAGLDPKHAMLVEQIIQRDHWTDEEFDEIASKQGLMPSGALEVVNEWAFDKFDEALLDEYEGYDVSPDIADTLRAEMAKGD
jgi:uncharacterized tellurite resistance protein B-like protein